ncbi:hypothetical protein N0V88_003259 [Collariella sp. IMI 366227]|nr:hypothetical protein N0V88_003259 [Collariella sp. IMI 366227]
MFSSLGFSRPRWLPRLAGLLDSNDINFFISTPDWYQYTAIGFGSSMADALMLVMYPSADRQSVTISPRLSTHAHQRDLPLLSLPSQPDPAHPLLLHPLLFAIGPLTLNSNNPDARIRRHVAYSSFTLDLTKAVGSGGIGAGVSGEDPAKAGVVTQNFRTPHQVIGLLTIILMTIIFVWGIALSWVKRAARKRGEEPPEKARLFGAIHKWACRVVWALLIVSVAL